METNKTPTSITLLFWSTEIVYWLYIAIMAGAIILCVRTFVGEYPDTLNLHVNAPFSFDIEEVGTLSTPKGDSEILLQEVTGKINFRLTPSYVTRPLAASLVVILGIMFVVIFSFRSFVKGIFRQGYFVFAHTIHLRNMAIWLAVLWLFTNLYFALFAHIIKPHINFEGISIHNVYKFDGSLLFVSLFIWVISHLIKTGINMKEEQNLTI